MKYSQIKLKKIKETPLNPLRVAAEHLLSSPLLSLFIPSLLGAAVFYKYYILVQKIEPELEVSNVRFEEGVYQKITEEWQDRGERFDAAKTKEYPNLFK